MLGLNLWGLGRWRWFPERDIFRRPLFHCLDAVKVSERLVLRMVVWSLFSPLRLGSFLCFSC